MIFTRPIRRTGPDEIRIRLGHRERDLLKVLPGQLKAILGTDDPSLRRLYPPAYTGEEHAEWETEYRHYMGGDLEARHARALDTLAETAGADRLTEEQATEWLAALNELRLVLGTRLDVGPDTFDDDIDPDDPQAFERAVYDFLSALQAELVEALSIE